MADASISEKVVSYTVGDKQFEGFIAWPANAGSAKLPGVMLIHEWRGHGDYVRGRARLVAKLGYVAFAADVYGKGVFAKDHDEAGQLVQAFLKDEAGAKARLEGSLAQLTAHANCDASKVVVAGYCFGGACALSLAKFGAKIAGVATFHASLKMGDQSPEAFKACKEVKIQSGPPSPGSPAKILICTGVDDPSIPVGEVTDWVKRASEAKIDFQILYLSGVLHSFTVPTANFPQFGAVYNADADRRSWSAFRYFLTDCFGAAEPPAALPTGPLTLGF
eukprot:tig00020563_g11215.t1